MEQEKGKGRDTDDNLLDFCVGETILPKLIPASWVSRRISIFHKIPFKLDFHPSFKCYCLPSNT